MCLFVTFSYQIVLLRGIARGLMAGVARPDVDSISNQSGDTFLLTDVEDDVPSLEEQQASIPASENLESNLQNLESNLSVCENSNTTYAAAAASAETPRVSEDDLLISRNYRNELFLSSFERENFHPDNVTPERPCTAYFQSDVFEDSSAVFSALRSQGFASSAIRCLQRRPTGEMLITFSTVHVKNAFLEKNSIQIRHRRYAINDSDRFLTFLNIYDAPHELSDNAIIKRLEPYCEVVNYRRGRYLSNKMVFNGNRHFRVRIHKAIPSYLRFGKFLIRLSHDGQTHTCRRCNRRGHFAKDCPNTVCFNCDELGHKVDECTHEELCCICKEPSHRARHCPYSWYRSSPVPSPQRDDPPASVSRDIDLPPLQRVPPANDPPLLKMYQLSLRLSLRTLVMTSLMIMASLYCAHSLVVMMIFLLITPMITPMIMPISMMICLVMMMMIMKILMMTWMMKIMMMITAATMSTLMMMLQPMTSMMHNLQIPSLYFPPWTSRLPPLRVLTLVRFATRIESSADDNQLLCLSR